MILLPENLPALRRPISNSRRRDWYRIENAKGADEAAEVYIYDEIGGWGILASDFVRDLQAVKAGRLNVHLNSPGGDVFDGIAIHNALAAHSASVHVVVDSLAASIASVIAMAGESITMARHSTMMIHDPYGMALGNAADMRQMAEVLNKMGDTIAGVYAERAGGSVREWRDRMLAETWYSDREAVAAGLANDVDGDAQAEDKFDLSHFKNPPADLLGQAGEGEETKPSKRDLERALRDAGLSRAEAKALLAKGLAEQAEDDGARDAAELSALLAALKQLV